MPRKCSYLVLALLVLCATTVDALGQDNTEQLKGVVVASHQDFPACPCGFCGGSVIVRVEKAGQQSPSYAIVDFVYGQNTSPYGVFASKKEWELTVVRAKELDGPLKEFYPVLGQDMSKEGDSRIPMWKVVGSGEELPYGEVIPTYVLAKNISDNITKGRRIPPFSRP